jgi:hypothetical protein
MKVIVFRSLKKDFLEVALAGRFGQLKTGNPKNDIQTQTK